MSGPQSFEEMHRGLKRRKEKLHQRNIQIKDLKHRMAELEFLAKKNAEALAYEARWRDKLIEAGNGLHYRLGQNNDNHGDLGAMQAWTSAVNYSEGEK